MVKSMTGFGRADYVDEDRKIVVEIKSVNSRYLDMNVKLPRTISRFETELKKTLKNYMERGKVDVYITYVSLADAGVTVKYEKSVAEQYVGILNQMKQDFGMEEDYKPTILARFPDVLSVDENFDIDDSEFEYINNVVKEAGEKFQESRMVEGQNISADLLGKVDELEGYVNVIEEKLPQIVEEYKNKLQEKINAILEKEDIDDSRIVQEVTIYADRVAVDEEMVRLHSHCKTVRELLRGDAAAGRKLDFIVQEMNREANTTLSKSDSLSTTDIGIEMKTCIEKIREQVQNIE